MPPLLKALRQLLSRDPPSAGDVNVEDEADRLHRSGDLEGAVGRYREAIALNPSSASAHYKLGVTLQRLGRRDEAIAHYEASHRSDPGSPRPLVNWGNALKDVGDLKGAADLYLRALQRDPDDVHALNNLATIARENGDLAQAESLYRRAALAAPPGYVDAEFNLGLIALERGDFAPGWDAYELRFRTQPPATSLPASATDRVDIEDLKEPRRVLVRSEQGIGDQILFSTLLPELARRCDSCVAEIDTRLIAAYRRSFPWIEFVEPFDLRAEEGADLRVACGSLPRLFRRDQADFARQPTRLLRPDAKRVQGVRDELGEGIRVAIAWRSLQGAGRLHTAQAKSAPLAAFGALAQPSLQLVDLQYGDVDSERLAFDARHPGLRRDIIGLDRFDDLEGAMAVLAACDLVVTTSNATAHLAGAVGARTWLVHLGGSAPFHYWAPGPDGRSRWYPSVEIVSAPRWTDWETAFGEIGQRMRRERPALEASSWIRRGDAFYHSGDIEGAKEAYAAAIAHDPRQVRAHYNLGVLLAAEGNLGAAIGHYRDCVALEPRDARALVNLANALKDLGGLEEAIALYRRALECDPDDAHALNNLAGIELERDDGSAARVLYARAARVGHPTARIGLGRAFLKLGDHDGALAVFEAIREANPDDAAGHNGRGLAQLARGRIAEAIADQRRAIELRPHFVKAWADLGEALRRQGRAEEAERALESALALPLSRELASELSAASAARLRAGDIAMARRFADRALEADARFLPARLNASLVALFEQDFARAWDDYALRFHVPYWPGRLTPCALPEPESLDPREVRRLAIRREQGIGDQLLFCTLLPEVVDRGVDAVVEIDERLIAAYRRRFPQLRFVRTEDAPAAFSSCDRQLPMGSLPRFLRRSRADFGKQPGSTLLPNEERSESLAGLLPEGPRIGISWRSFRERLGEIKSFELERFGAFERCGVRLVDLQYGDVETERRRFDDRHPGLRWTIPGLDARNDLEGLLAAIDACDLVITCSNATAHLAGALGKRTWLLYLRGASPFHYWVPGPDGRSLWYPSVEILTDPRWGVWDLAFDAVIGRWKGEAGGAPREQPQAPGIDGLLDEGADAYRRGDARAALRAYERAIAADAGHGRAHYGLGVVLEALGERERAMGHYRDAARISSGDAKPLVNWGKLLVAQGELQEGRDRFMEAVVADPRDAIAQQNLLTLGTVFERRGDLDDARACYEALLDAHPDHALANYNLAVVLNNQGFRDEAVARYRRAISSQPDFTHALNNLATLLLRGGDLAEAYRLFERVVALDPSHHLAMSNLATAALDLGRVAQAREWYERVLEAKPDLPVAAYNLSLLSLREHDFARGWPGFERRFERDGIEPPVPLPRAQRVDLSPGSRIAIWSEQGIGDQLLFSTLLGEVRSCGAQAVVEADPRLLDAYRRSIDGIRFVSSEDSAEALAACDFQLALGSLPGLFRIDVPSFARQPEALLKVDDARARRVGRELPRGPRIAISWRSHQPDDRRHVEIRKSAPLDCFGAFEGAGASLVDVQYGDALGERARFDERHPGLRVEVHGLDRFHDLEGVMATLSACDLVVTSSNVTAHLAGAIGKRTWLVYLEANSPFHYWVPGPNGRCLWYPSVEIVTDASWQRWEQAIEAVARRWRLER